MKAFFKLIGISIQAKMYYKLSFIINLVSPLVLLAGQYLLWNSIYAGQNTGDIGGMSKSNMFSYILIAFALNNLLTWSSENALSREIRSGTVVSRCIRPVSFLLQSTAEMTGSLLLQGTVNFFVVIIGYICFSSFLNAPSFLSILIFIPCLIMGILLRMLMVNLVSLLCFFTTGHLGITWTRQALFEFFSGAIIPITLFPQWLSTVAYLTPFPYMIQAPVAIFLNQEIPVSAPMILLLQAVWIAIFLVAYNLLYIKIRKNLTIAGG